MRTEVFACQREDHSDVAIRRIRQRRGIVGRPPAYCLHNSKDIIMPPVLKFVASAFLVFTLLAAPVRAEEVRAGDLVIKQAWSRATPGGAKIGSGYLTIENKGSTADRLIVGPGDVTDRIERGIHVDPYFVCRPGRARHRFSAQSVTQGGPQGCSLKLSSLMPGEF